MSDLKSILAEIKNELREKDLIREKARKDMREVTSVSKQAILLLHQKRYVEANRLIRRAKRLLTGLNRDSKVHPSLVLGEPLNAAFQEYSEASIFYSLILKKHFVSAEDINVPATDYVLGLSDVIGECRRSALDSLRDGNLKDAERYLELMDEIYVDLLSLDESYMLVPGLRRKTDVARKIIEITRGDVTQENRRNMLEQHLEKLEKKLIK